VEGFAEVKNRNFCNGINILSVGGTNCRLGFGSLLARVRGSRWIGEI